MASLGVEGAESQVAMRLVGAGRVPRPGKGLAVVGNGLIDVGSLRRLALAQSR